MYRTYGQFLKNMIYGSTNVRIWVLVCVFEGKLARKSSVGRKGHYLSRF